jgi:hypothetical protein
MIGSYQNKAAGPADAKAVDSALGSTEQAEAKKK